MLFVYIYKQMKELGKPKKLYIDRVEKPSCPAFPDRTIDKFPWRELTGEGDSWKPT